MLYLVATPIGNLGDITLRAIETLKAADVIYCEDTRRTGQLLTHLGIEKPVLSCHSHNERARSEQLLQALAAGQEVAYVSDAGMPAVSDPGAVLAQACIAGGFPYTVVPGASAVLTAAVLSGLPPQPFSFFGFLPRESKPRKETLAAIGSVQHQVILYESPHRVQATLRELEATFGDCQAAVLRELTKKFETVYRGTFQSLIPLFETEPKGECVLAFVPKPKPKPKARSLDEALLVLLATCSVKDAAAQAANELGVPKKEAYARALALRGEQ